jgi:hypothetical protein
VPAGRVGKKDFFLFYCPDLWAIDVIEMM